MRQKVLVTGKVTILVVDIRPGDTYTHLEAKGWQHLGKATELTEEDWKGIVENHEYPFQEGSFCYPDYEVYPKIAWKAFNTAAESGLSLLKANGVVLENDVVVDEKPWQDEDVNAFTNYMYKESLERWQEAESKVWRNCYVFIKQQ